MWICKVEVGSIRDHVRTYTRVIDIIRSKVCSYVYSRIVNWHRSLKLNSNYRLIIG